MTTIKYEYAVASNGHGKRVAVRTYVGSKTSVPTNGPVADCDGSFGLSVGDGTVG